MKVCFDETLLLKVGTINLNIYEDSVRIIENSKAPICQNEIETFGFLTNIKQSSSKEANMKRIMIHYQNN
jgi:hypothetical protein